MIPITRRTTATAAPAYTAGTAPLSLPPSPAWVAPSPPGSKPHKNTQNQTDQCQGHKAGFIALNNVDFN